MPRHTDVFVYSTELIDLMLNAFDDAEIARELCCELDGDTVIDPQCWCRVAWPDHVVNARFNSDATYHRADESEITEESGVHSFSMHRR